MVVITGKDIEQCIAGGSGANKGDSTPAKRLAARAGCDEQMAGRMIEIHNLYHGGFAQRFKDYHARRRPNNRRPQARVRDPHIDELFARIQALKDRPTPTAVLERVDDKQREIQDREDQELQRARDKVSKRINLDAAARHEAAHALFVLLPGGKVSSVEVRDDGSGTCYFVPDSLTPSQRITMTIAGCIGQNCQKGINDPGAQLDRQQLLDELRRLDNERIANDWKLTGADALSDDKLLEMAIDNSEYVRNTIDRYWSFFSSLALALIDRRRLSGREVHEMWDSYREANPFTN